MLRPNKDTSRSVYRQKWNSCDIENIPELNVRLARLLAGTRLLDGLSIG